MHSRPVVRLMLCLHNGVFVNDPLRKHFRLVSCVKALQFGFRLQTVLHRAKLAETVLKSFPGSLQSCSIVKPVVLHKLQISKGEYLK